MAKLSDRLPENAPGDFFVDASCIDCDTCRQIAPKIFGSTPGDQSFVAHQPASQSERLRAAMALVACPTSSIGSASKDDVRAGAAAFPEEIAPGIHYVGYTSEQSFGASSYLVQRSAGNVLIDSPRAARPLLARIGELGGVSRMFLTHKDDVADHAVFRRTFGCERILHAADLGRGGLEVERSIEGSCPVALDEDLVVIPLPGHTRGSAALLYGETYLFTGDHLWWSEERHALHASKSVCWYSWPEQTRSMERLLDYRFEWVLPGHGRRYRARSAAAMREHLEELIGWMRAA